MKILANEQAFQSIYLNPHADSWEDKIVFLEPLFDTLPPAQMVLKTLRFEDKSGIVLSGPKASLLKLKEHIYNADTQSSIGKSSDEDILKYLAEIALEKGLSVELVRSKVEAKLQQFSERKGFKKHGDTYVSADGTRAFTVIEGKLYGMSTSDFELRGINKISAILDESWGESKVQFSFNDPYYIPKGISKVEAARWYVKARRISKPENTLMAISKLAQKGKSVIGKYKSKFEKIGLDLWHDVTETEFVGLTTTANYEEGVSPERVAYYDLKTKDLQISEVCENSTKELFNSLVKALEGES